MAEGDSSISSQPTSPLISSIESIKKKIYYHSRHGMAVALCEQLTEVKQSEDTLRELISQVVEEEGQKCTPLIIAARHGHDRVVRMLLKYKPDLEQEGTVKFDGYPIEGASALWCAAGAGHLGVVKLLVRSGANVNHTTKTNSTPVRAACFDGRLDIVKYLTEHKADIHITNKYNNTCLMIASYKGHLDIVNYLLELGANPNEKAHCGATALHFAAECGHVQIVATLLEHGAIVVSNEHNMTPLMAAAERACLDVVEYLITREETDSKEKIESLELLGASYASDKDHYDLDIAYNYLERAMVKRYEDPNNIIAKDLGEPLAPYNYHKECETLEELQSIKHSPSSLHMEALSIRERILGPNNPEVPPAIIFRGAVFADHARFDRCLQLWMHALSLKLSTNLCVVKDLLRFAQVFSQMVHVGVELDFNIVLEVLEATTIELQRNHSKLANPGPKDDVVSIKEEVEQNMITSLYLIMICQRVLKVPFYSTGSPANNNNRNNNNNNNNNNNLPREVYAIGWGDVVASGGAMGALPTRRNVNTTNATVNKKIYDEMEVCEREMRLHKAVYRLVRHNFRTSKGQSLLHLCVSPDTPVDDFHTNLICRFPCANTTKLLLMCGADPNALDNLRNTPLHYIVPYQKPISDFLTLHNIILNLVEAKAHMDIVNKNGITPFKAATTGVAEVILRTQQGLSLQCLAARSVVEANLPYRGCVPRHLEPFIELHAPAKPTSPTRAPSDGINSQL